MELLYAIIAIVLIATPVLAILAFAGVRRIENSFGNLPLQNLVSYIYALEQRLAAMEKKYAELSTEQIHLASSAESPRPEAPRPSVPAQSAAPTSPGPTAPTPGRMEAGRSAPSAPID